MEQDPAEAAYWNLVAAARAEQGIAPEEQKVLNAHALKLGLDGATARRVQADAVAENPPRMRLPRDEAGRRSTLRAVLEVVAADGSLAPKELAIVRALCERLGLGSASQERLLKAALRRSAADLDRAFAALGADLKDPGPEPIALARPKPEPRRAAELLRAMPFAARWAPRFRNCKGCALAFANEDSYAHYCRDCRIHERVREWTGGRIETLTGLLFVVLLAPSAWVVYKTTGLWGWGWEMASAPSYGYRRRRSGNWIYYAPAFAATAIPAWLLAWLITRLVMGATRRPR